MLDQPYRVMLSAEQIQSRVAEMGAQISEDYKDNDAPLVLIGLLRGSFMFMADLCRQVSMPHEVDFMTVSSYGDQTVTSNNVKVLKDLDGHITNKHVLIVEDIIDSGHTLDKVMQLLQIRQPKSLQLCTMISKPSRRQIELDVKYIGFEIDDHFIVGYGLDYDQKYRHLPFIADVGL